METESQSKFPIASVKHTRAGKVSTPVHAES